MRLMASPVKRAQQAHRRLHHLLLPSFKLIHPHDVIQVSRNPLSPISHSNNLYINKFRRRLHRLISHNTSNLLPLPRHISQTSPNRITLVHHQTPLCSRMTRERGCLPMALSMLRAAMYNRNGPEKHNHREVIAGYNKQNYFIQLWQLSLRIQCRTLFYVYLPKSAMTFSTNTRRCT